MDEKRALELMQDAFDSMQRCGMLAETIEVAPETVILGTGSHLDSLGFVTFISDMEERVSAEVGQDVYLILTDIHEFNEDQTRLSVGTLAGYIAQISR